MGDLDNAGQPALTLGRGWAFYVGPVEAGQVHRHHAEQIAWSVGGLLKVAGPWGSLEAHGHVLAADVPHCLSAPLGVRMVFLDPTMCSAVKGDVAKAGVVALTALQVNVLEAELTRWHESAASDGFPEAARHASEDRRLRETAEWVERSLDGRVRCQDAALAAGLSESHFMHWFAEHSGLAFRAYVRWLRLQRAVRALADGSNLTAAAHEAGFSDSAHLSRTVVATFGIRPASLRAIRIRCTDRMSPPVTLGGLAIDSPSTHKHDHPGHSTADQGRRSGRR